MALIFSAFQHHLDNQWWPNNQQMNMAAISRKLYYTLHLPVSLWNLAFPYIHQFSHDRSPWPLLPHIKMITKTGTYTDISSFRGAPSRRSICCVGWSQVHAFLPSNCWYLGGPAARGQITLRHSRTWELSATPRNNCDKWGRSEWSQKGALLTMMDVSGWVYGNNFPVCFCFLWGE